MTATEIKFGGIQMHGMPLGNLLVDPQVRGDTAALNAINDSGGIYGRKLRYIDCDDGPGETSRAKACMKKLVEQDQIFALLTSVTWSSIPITNDDLERTQTPWIGAWSYGFVEWTNPWSLPSHMSMMSESNAGAEWVRDVIKPKKFGLICLNAPEMQRSCQNVNNVLTAAGAKMVKKVDVSLTPGDLSGEVIAMRAAEPDHIIHYVINPASIAKFVVDATQQQYWPPKGMSGNHLAAEILGEIFGDWPVNRYWTNTTYKLWGPDFMATMKKYAPNNQGMNHHIVQAGFAAANFAADALRRIGPQPTRAKLMRLVHTPGTFWQTDAGLDQKFFWSAGDRFNPASGGRREFIYKYTSSNTVANPDSSPHGFAPDPDKFEIHDDQPVAEQQHHGQGERRQRHPGPTGHPVPGHHQSVDAGDQCAERHDDDETHPGMELRSAAEPEAVGHDQPPIEDRAHQDEPAVEERHGAAHTEGQHQRHGDQPVETGLRQSVHQ